jgi:predicted nucleic acid-binding protein
VSDDAGAAPPPYVLDVSTLTAVARGDAGVMSLVQVLDGQGRRLVIPVLAVAAASLDTRSDDADELLEGLDRLENALTAPLQDTEQADRLAAVTARTGLDFYDAHVAAVADASVCPILTLDGDKWRDHAHDLEEPLHFIEIAEPGDDN